MPRTLTTLGVAVVLAATVLGAVGGLPARTVHAANYTVTKTADTNDGTCNADCSLREAIDAANANAGADTITLPAGTYTLTIAGAPEDANATGDLDVTQAGTLLTINGAGAGSTIIDGGALDNVIEALGTASLTMNDVTVRNGAGGSGDGVDGEQGSIALFDAVVTGNANFGVSTDSAQITLTNVTVSDNGSVGVNTNSGDIFVITSTISGNGDEGIATVNGNVNLRTSTISDNNDDGIFTQDGNVELHFTTVAHNDGNGVDITESGLLFMSGAIVADNDSDDCRQQVESSDHSIDTDGSCGLSGTGDISDGSPDLGPLQDNGGPTETRALLGESDAIDAGGDGCDEEDQRGVARPQGDACDMGAYEVNGEQQPTATPCEQEQECATATATAKIKTHTPTPSSTAAPSETPKPATSTPVAPPPAVPTHTGGQEGIISGPDTGSGGSSTGGAIPFWTLGLLSLGGLALVTAGAWRRRA